MIVVWGVRVILLAAFLLFWQYADTVLGWLFGSTGYSLLFSTPTEVATALVHMVMTGRVFPQIGLTTVEVLSAFAIGTALALLFGALLAASSCVTVVLRPFIRVLDAVPRLVLMPVFLIALGLAVSSKIVFGAFLAFSAALIEICAGLSRPSDVLAAAADGGPAPGRGRWSTFIDAWMTGLRPAMRYCFAGVVIGEYLGASNGLGYQVENALQMLAMPTMYAALLLLIALAAIFDAFASKSSWTAIIACFGKYAMFDGRSSRSEVWYFILFCVLTNFFVGLIAGNYPIVRFVVALALLLPLLSVQVRRLHDVGQPGLWVLIGFIPVVGDLVLLYWFCVPGTPGKNQYGEALRTA